MSQLFDQWPDPYERWFQTPIGALVKATELELMLKLLNPQAEEQILDAGCGSGIFTAPLSERGCRITGLDLSLPMLDRARTRLLQQQFLAADMCKLPFADNCFDKTVSITALEFIEDGEQAMAELFRVTRPGGTIVVATLNSLSPWAAARREKAEKDPGSVFNQAFFRSPDQLLSLVETAGETRTAVHFDKNADPHLASKIERRGLQDNLDTGAFLIGSWTKP